MMAPPSAATSYKKKAGSLSLTDNEETLIWAPEQAGAAGVKITVSSITSMKLFDLPDVNGC